MHLSLSKCYTLKKTVNDTKSIASKRKYIIRGTELIILILFQKIYKSFPYIYSWNCQHYFTIVKYQCQNSLTGAYHHRPHHFSLPLLFYFFSYKSLVLMEEVKAAPIFHTSFILFK